MNWRSLLAPARNKTRSLLLEGQDHNFAMLGEGHVCMSALPKLNAVVRALVLSISLFSIIYNVGTRFASLAVANPQELREQRFGVKLTYSFSPSLGRRSSEKKAKP
jgi:hypothetical protein